MRLDVREDSVFRCAKLEDSICDSQSRRQRELNGREKNNHRAPSRCSLYYACNFIFRWCRASHVSHSNRLRIQLHIRCRFAICRSNRSNANRDRKERQDLTHTKRSGNKAKLNIWLPGELDEIAHQSVADKEHAADETISIPSAAHSATFNGHQYNEKQYSFEQCFIELRRMTSDSEWIGRENHRPWNVRSSAVELTVDEVPDASEKKSGRRSKSYGVCNGPEWYIMPSRKDEHRDRHSQCGSVKRQSTMPHRKRIEWLREIMRAIVHEYVQCSRAEQHSDHEISDEGIDCRFVEWRKAAPDSAFCNCDADDVPDEVHDAVPPHGNRPDAKYFGRNARVRNCHA